MFYIKEPAVKAITCSARALLGPQPSTHPRALKAQIRSQPSSSRTIFYTRDIFLNKVGRSTMTMHAEKTVLVPVANGSEEIEAVTIIDTLRRAGANVTVASVEKELQVEMSRKVKLVADTLIEKLKGQTFDLIALPGGMPGAERLRDNETLAELLREQHDTGRFVTAICAAPAVVLEAKGYLKGRKATAHPAFSDKLSDQSAVNEGVVVDGNVITSKGPATSLSFALRLVSALYSAEKADEVAAPMGFSK